MAKYRQNNYKNQQQQYIAKCGDQIKTNDTNIHITPPPTCKRKKNTQQLCNIVLQLRKHE